jgi:hypothetical protein
LDELQTSINSPVGSYQRSDATLPGSLYGALAAPSPSGTLAKTKTDVALLSPAFVVGENDKITRHEKEEYVSPDKKTHTFKESYDFSGQGGGVSFH